MSLPLSELFCVGTVVNGVIIAVTEDDVDVVTV